MELIYLFLAKGIIFQVLFVVFFFLWLNTEYKYWRLRKEIAESITKYFGGKE